MLLRLLRGRRGRLGRGRAAIGAADRGGNSRLGETRSEAGTGQTGASQTGASQSGRPGSHRKTKPSAAAGWPSNGTRSGLSAALRDARRSAATGEAGPGATPPASAIRPATRAGAHRAGAAAASGPAPSDTAPRGTAPSRTAPSSAVSSGTAGSNTAARAAIRVAPDIAGSAPSAGIVQPAQRTAASKPATASDAQPWYATAGSSRVDLGLRDCGVLEQVLIREWDTDAPPAPETVFAINRLAGLPQLIKEKLVAGLDAIHVGGGGVPDLDHMGELKGVPLPSGRATWDACAGAYGDRKIIVGSRPSPTPDVMCHEVGHALDDLDGAPEMWQSDSADFTALYSRCLPHLAIEFHRRDGAFGRREFFADTFAAIASGQRPALVDMLSGNTRGALDVMLYFNVRYGI
jgi:hypothetical protein